MMSSRLRAGLLYFIIVISTLVLRVCTYLGVYENLGIGSDEYFTPVVQVLIFGGISLAGYFLFSLKNKNARVSFREDFGFKKISGKDFLRTLAIMVCTIIVSTGISYVWQVILSVIGYTRVPSSTDYSSVSMLFRQLLLTALLPGVFEEIANRGLLYSGYRECGWKFVFVSGIMFSLIHQNIVQTGYAFFDGCIIALVMFYTGSIWPGMIIHFVNNAYSVTRGYFSQNGGPLSFIETASDWLSSTTGGYIVSVLCILVAGLLLILLFARMRKDAVKRGVVKENILFEKTDAMPLYKDIPFIVCTLTGIAATVFSLVWGMMR